MAVVCQDTLTDFTVHAYTVLPGTVLIMAQVPAMVKEWTSVHVLYTERNQDITPCTCC